MMLPTVRKTQNWLPLLFNDFFETDGFGKLGSTAPAINVIESDKEYQIELAAPGMSKEDFTIRVDNENQLIISMEKKEEHNDERKNAKYLRREFSYSKFEQALLLPDDIVKDNIQAAMKHGVLKVSVPKNLETAQQPKERLIEIQ